jgi:hypothetical protein
MDQLTAQKGRSYTDPLLGDVTPFRGEDNCFGCPHCGKRITRISGLKIHANIACTIVKDKRASHTTETSRIFPANEGLHSTPSEDWITSIRPGLKTIEIRYLELHVVVEYFLQPIRRETLGAGHSPN